MDGDEEQIIIDLKCSFLLGHSCTGAVRFHCQEACRLCESRGGGL